MASVPDNPSEVTPRSIAALPQTTVRRLGSSQVLVDPASVVKVLLDNALDGRATAVFLDIAANTVDYIHAKDTGHGIPQEDRALVCRRYCTSKIRDAEDLKGLGGKLLGFRGEALASIAEMVGTLEITTRVEGETVAAKMSYGHDGELKSIARVSAPIGTTVKVTKIFEQMPVRKQSALKNSARCLARIRRLFQAYALVRPNVRFSMRVKNANTPKGDFLYAPKQNANVEEAVLGVIRKDCALQCEWIVVESNGFEVQAFLPKPDAVGSKIASIGAFISVDARPMGSSRGVPKQIMAAFKSRLRKSNPALGCIRDPFFYLNISCPPNSYDPNVEPEKDDVLFVDPAAVLAAADKLLIAYYPGSVAKDVFATPESEPPTSAQRPCIADHLSTPISPYKGSSNNEYLEPTPSTSIEQPVWKATMYGVNEDDFGLASTDPPDVDEAEEDEEFRHTSISNPWKMAKMNALIDKEHIVADRQLITPSKTSSDALARSGFLARAVDSNYPVQWQHLNPLRAPRPSMMQTFLDKELQNSMQRLHSPSVSSTHNSESCIESTSGLVDLLYETPVCSIRARARTSAPISLACAIPSGGLPHLIPRSSHPFEANSPNRTPPFNTLPSSSPTTGFCQEQDRQGHIDDAQAIGPWFGQMTGEFRIPKRTRRSKEMGSQTSNTPLSSDGQSNHYQRPYAEERIGDSPLTSGSNTDVRNFLACKAPRRDRSAILPLPMNVHPLSERGSSKSADFAAGGQQKFKPWIKRPLPSDKSSCAASLESSPHSKEVMNRRLVELFHKSSIEHPNAMEKSLAYTEHDIPFDESWTRLSAEDSSTPNDVAGMSHDFRREHYSSCLRFVEQNEPIAGPSTFIERRGTSTAPPERRCATDRTQRTKSMQWLLERVPDSHGTHNLVAHLAIQIPIIVKTWRIANAGKDDPGTVAACLDSLASRTLQQLTSRVIILLDQLHEREPGVDALSALECNLRNAINDIANADHLPAQAIRKTVPTLQIEHEIDDHGHEHKTLSERDRVRRCSLGILTVNGGDANGTERRVDCDESSVAENGACCVQGGIRQEKSGTELRKEDDEMLMDF